MLHKIGVNYKMCILFKLFLNSVDSKVTSLRANMFKVRISAWPIYCNTEFYAIWKQVQDYFSFKCCNICKEHAFVGSGAVHLWSGACESSEIWSCDGGQWVSASKVSVPHLDLLDRNCAKKSNVKLFHKIKLQTEILNSICCLFVLFLILFFCCFFSLREGQLRTMSAITNRRLSSTNLLSGQRPMAACPDNSEHRKMCTQKMCGVIGPPEAFLQCNGVGNMCTGTWTHGAACLSLGKQGMSSLEGISMQRDMEKRHEEEMSFLLCHYSHYHVQQWWWLFSSSNLSKWSSSCPQLPWWLAVSGLH